MKKILIVAMSVATLSLSAFAQGTFNMIWADGVNAISIGAAHNQGTTGWLLGDEYSAQAYLGTTGGALSPVAASMTRFDLAGGPSSATGTAANFAGQFYVLSGVVTALPLGAADIQVRAWYNGGQYSTYEAALGGGANVGQSSVFSITLKAATDPTVSDLTGMAPFTVGVVPEPSTIALAGLGAASLLMFRRRK